MLKMTTIRLVSLYKLDKTLATNHDDIANLFCNQEIKQRIKTKILTYKKILWQSNKESYETEYIQIHEKK